MSEDLRYWQVEYSATYWVKATDEDHAIDLAVEQHSEFPNGDWEANLEQWPPAE